MGGRCVCEGHSCSVNSVCKPQCSKFPGGSCSMFNCKSSRGPTNCISGACMCKHGYCEEDGVCVSISDEFLGSLAFEEEIPQTTPEHNENLLIVMAAAAGFVSGSLMVGIALYIRRRTVALSDEPLLVA